MIPFLNVLATTRSGTRIRITFRDGLWVEVQATGSKWETTGKILAVGSGY